MSRRLLWTVRACCAALMLGLAWPVVLRRIFPLSDILSFHVPLRRLYQQMLEAGDSPLWTPSLFAGFHLHGEGQLGLFHPLHQVLYRLLPLDLALNLEILTAYGAALAGMQWFLRRLTLPPTAALFGAMAFAFGGFMVTHYPHVNMIAVVAHMPWLLGCLDVILVEPSRARRAAGYAGAAGVLASQLLLGFPQGAWWTLLAGGAFMVWRAREARAWWRLVPCGCALATGLLLGGVQLLPTLDAASRSVRTEAPRSFFLGYSLHPWNLVQLWSPYGLTHRAYTSLDRLQFHEFALYPGAFLVLAPLWLWVRRHALASRRALIAAASAFAAVMFVLALGHYGTLAVLLTFVPGVGSFRAPARYILLVQFALAVLAAIAVEDLATIPRRGYRLSRVGRLAVGTVLILSVATTLLLNTGTLPVRADLLVSSVPHALVGTLFAAAAALLVLFAARGRSWALPVLVIVSAADIGLWGLSYIHRLPPQRIEWFAGGIPVRADAAPVRIVAPSNWNDRPLMHDYQLVNGYVGLYPRTRLPPSGDAFRRLAGARLRMDLELRVTELGDGVPRTRLLTDVRVTADPAADIGAIDLEQAALVDAPVPALSGDRGSTRVVLDRPGHLIVETRASGRQLLSVSERYEPGWRAIDESGRTLPVLPVNGDFIGVVVDAGAHRVDLAFRPASLRWGAALTGAGAIALLAGVLIVRGPRAVEAASNLRATRAD